MFFQALSNACFYPGFYSGLCNLWENLGTYKVELIIRWFEEVAGSPEEGQGKR